MNEKEVLISYLRRNRDVMLWKLKGTTRAPDRDLLELATPAITLPAHG